MSETVFDGMALFEFIAEFGEIDMARCTSMPIKTLSERCTGLQQRPIHLRKTSPLVAEPRELPIRHFQDADIDDEEEGMLASPTEFVDEQKRLGLNQMPFAWCP